MPTINQLATIDSVSSGDLLPTYSTSNGDARKMSIGTLLTYFKETFTSPTFVASITAIENGQTVSATNDSTNQWVLLTPAGAIATGTVVLPISTGLVDGQEVMFTSSNTITALTINGNGSTVVGGPSTIGATSPFKLRYNLLTASWYKAI